MSRAKAAVLRRLHRSSVIVQAKKVVPLPMVLGMTGYPIDGLPDRGVAIKAWCPWTDMHPEGKREKEMRVYAGNDCFCFICQLTMDPVSIAARLWGVSNPEAARRLLALVSESTDGVYSSASSDAPDLSIVHDGARAGDLSGLEARRRAGACAALGRWADAHGVDRFSESYGRCLDLADHIVDDDQVVSWMSACKSYLLSK